MPGQFAVVCVKMAEPIKVLFGLCTQVGPRKRVCDMEVHIGTTWWIQLNCLWSAALQKWLNWSRCHLGV